MLLSGSLFRNKELLMILGVLHIAVHSLSSESYAWRPYDFAWNFYISPASRVFGIYNNQFPAKILIFATEFIVYRLSCILSFIDNLQRDFADKSCTKFVWSQMNRVLSILIEFGAKFLPIQGKLLTWFLTFFKCKTKYKYTKILFKD